MVAKIEPRAPSDQSAYQQILDALGQVSLTRSRLTNAATATIPTALFAILVVLAVATLRVAAAMDTRHRRSHLMILAALAIAMGTTLALVAGLDYPYRGFIRIDTSPLSQFVANRNAR